MRKKNFNPQYEFKIAHRRIEDVPKPKRWTAEVQKAGRLPEVGGECQHCQSKLVKSVIAVTATHVVIDANNGVGVAPDVLRHDEFMQYYIPIETPDEKAARLKLEWSYKALSITPAHDPLNRCYENKIQKDISAIYDALLSGELPPVQAKDGE